MARGLPLPIYVVRPPYERFVPLPSIAALERSDLSPGSVLAIGVAAPERDWLRLQGVTPQLRSRFPGAALILRVPRTPDAASVHLARRAGELHIRAVLLESEPIELTLRRILTRPVELPSEVLEWLTVRGTTLTPELGEVVHEIFASTTNRRRMRELVPTARRSERTIRGWFRARNLPVPTHWFAAARGVRAALAMQADIGDPLFHIALQHGYTDHSSLSRQLVRLFGLRPSAIRRALGWEWLLDRWLIREGRAASLYSET